MYYTHFLWLFRNLHELHRWRVKGRYNYGEISPRVVGSLLSRIKLYYTLFHLHYPPTTCELARCNSWTRCQKLVPGIHKNESSFRDLLRKYNEPRKTYPRFTCFRIMLREDEYLFFLSLGVCTVALSPVSLSRNKLTTPVTINIGVYVCTHTHIQYFVIARKSRSR